MNKVLYWIFAAAVFLGTSCARELESDDDRIALTLQFAGQTASKVDALAAGDVAGVFMRTEGMDVYAFENYRFVADASGTLLGDPAVFFPDARQAAQLRVYLPYMAGQADPSAVAFTTPVDQTSNSQQRQADLLWGRVASTPMREAVPVPLEHQLAKLTVATSQPIARWAVHDVLIQCDLNVETGVLTLGTTRADVATTGHEELILAPQSIQTLDFTVGGVDYTFEAAAPIALEAGKSHALHLTLHPANHTATLSEPIGVTDWTVAGSNAAVEGAVDNQFTVYWALPSIGYQYASKAIVHLTAADGVARDLPVTQFTRVSVDNELICTYSFELTNGSLAYPYKIDGVSFFDGSDKLIQRCSSLLGASVYKSGDYTLGIEAGNVLTVVEGRVNSFTEVFGSGAISGGVANQFVLQLLEPQSTGYDYTQIRQVRLTAAGVTYLFSSITFTANSNILVAITRSFAFTTVRPAGYPYTVERIELLDGAGVVVGGTAGVFDADVVVSRGGVITMQLFRGKATGLISGTSFVAYGNQGSTDAPIFTGTVVDSPVSLVYTLGNGMPSVGKEATAVTQAQVVVKTADGVSHTVSLSPYVMTGTPLAAHSTAINIASCVGWPAGAKFPYQITHVALLDKSDNPIVPSTELSTPLDVRWSGKASLSVMKYN